ncbi:MAG: polyphosphate kinase 2 family protein [Pseudobdellovibrionaceae bacterium]
MKESKASEQNLKDLQLKMLRIQQGIWHQKKRAIILFEGFDAAGKGGAIRRVVEPLDPRGVRVHAIGPPEGDEQAKHYLYRFWKCLPAPGSIAIFDRSWYGRVLVEKVNRLTPKKRLEEAYAEIMEFEKMLTSDGIDLVKIFLAIDKEEQLKRFEERLKDPYKQWKLTTEDVKSQNQWGEYVNAADEMFQRTSHHSGPWDLIPANDKDYTRLETLKVITKSLKGHKDWMESLSQKVKILTLSSALKELSGKGTEELRS